MGAPIVDVKFKELTSTAVARSERGIVALILEDDSGLSEMLSAAADAQEGWNSASREKIAMAFAGGAYRVIAMCAGKGEDGSADYDAAMKKADRLKWNWLAAPDAKEADMAKIAAAIKSARAVGKTRKAVLACASRAVQRGNCQPLHRQHHKHGERNGKELFGRPIYAESGGRSGSAAAGQVCHRI